MHAARVFLSHSSTDSAASLRIRDELVAHGIDAWSYERDMGFGCDFRDRVRAGITACDHLLVVLSDSAASSDWVGRELGLALHLRHQRGLKHPTIVGVRGAASCSSARIVPRDFDSGARWAEPFDFSTGRHFQIGGATPDDITWLADQLRCRVTFVTQADGHEADLFHESRRCYEILFPDRREREDHANIDIWLDAARRAMDRGGPWREVYAVLHLGELVTGLAYMSLHVERHLCFGNYFGVLPVWRQNGRAEWLLKQVWARLLDLDKHLRAITFEIEPFDVEALLVGAAGYPASRSLPPPVVDNLRSIRRLLLYQGYGARALLTPRGVPIGYVQPALREPLDRTNEVAVTVMAAPAPGTWFDDLDAKALVRFLYHDIYGEAYGGQSDTGIPGYDEYLSSVERRVFQEMDLGWRFGTVAVPPEARRLLCDLKHAGLAATIEL